MSTTRTTSKSLRGVPASSDRTQSSSDDAPALGLHVVTFGCQMNKYDSLLVEGRFRESGYRIAETMEDASVILFNTCSVRDHAEERTLSWLGELKHEKETRPELVIGVMGCMAQRREDDVFRRAGHVDIVCGTRRFPYLPEMVDEVRRRRTDGERPKDARVLETGEARPDWRIDRSKEPYTGGLVGYLAVMRGCDLNCTYCIVPRTRGRVQSRPIDQLLDEARWMIEGGAKVVTLLGQTVNSYGEDMAAPAEGEPQYSGRKGRPALADLLYAMQELEGLERIRMITLHPSYVTPSFAKAIADCDKVDRFLPLPVQSGSDSVLRDMKRGYNVELFKKRVQILRDAVPDIELGSDWIVGFPTESDEDFDASERLLADVGFAQNYVFKYDPRPGTVSDDREDCVATPIKKARNQRLLKAAEQSGLKRTERFLNQEVDVFVEKQGDRNPELVVGRTAHYFSISFEGSPELIGKMVRVKVQQASPYNLAGELVTESLSAS
ncbi:MAG: tRNA (N6-isopentenyl adenosine(37)-C2)-methylthiotransferase MiaB [Planctomycetota bacterium]|nr:tRNA (N6-isopentenyl adenosine(37)-C2)-methylthiotransferase MiaB [Planctomycetota bacterium]MDG2142676.1 tRNA (N6-isopentenyl adenosine(37)-C2)-methylthiotransferase MiaB [Planctomycetota bacterium]